MIKIEINADPSEFEAHLRALGYIRAPIGVGERTESPLKIIADSMRNGTAKFVGASETTHPEPATAPEAPNTLADELAALERPEDFKAPGQPARQPGQPAPGRKRRTREEINEDEKLAYLKTDAPAISTGEERIDPGAATQDAADEAAETAARATDKPTLDDLRAAALRYQEKFGVKAAVDNMRGIIGCAIAEVKPEGIADAISRVEAAINGSTVMGVPNGEAVEPEAPATGNKGDVVLAVTAYGKKFDGTGDPAHMIFTREDMPKLFQKLFGEAAVSIGTIPQTPESFGKAVAAINAAVHDNPFQRKTRQ